MGESLLIPGRFNGPLESGNGGYCAGVVANLIGGPAEVSLRRPVPLDTPLDLVRRTEGEILVLDRDGVVAEGHPVAELDVDVPAPVSSSQARLAATRYRGSAEGMFSRCFVCGLAREDAFGVFAGAVEGRQLVASPWTPPPWAAGADGHVRPELLWAVLDCPTYFAVYMASDQLPLSVLARLAAQIEAPAVAGEEHVVVGWPIETDGRKQHAGSAVLSRDGEVLAVAHALLIEPRAG